MSTQTARIQELERKVKVLEEKLDRLSPDLATVKLAMTNMDTLAKEIRDLCRAATGKEPNPAPATEDLDIGTINGKLAEADAAQVAAAEARNEAAMEGADRLANLVQRLGESKAGPPADTRETTDGGGDSDAPGGSDPAKAGDGSGASSS